MKKLFIIYESSKKKNDEKDVCPTRNDFESNSQSLKLSEIKSIIENSPPSTTSMSSPDSRKFSLNMASPEHPSTFNLNTAPNSTFQDKETNNFLGKKTRLHFDIIKLKSQKYESNLLNDHINIHKENSKKENEDSLINHEENRSLFFISESSKSIKSENDLIIEEKQDEERCIYNAGTKDLDTIVKLGKNWEKMQKCLHSPSPQSKPRTQQFLLEVKKIKGSKLDLDLSNSASKTLSSEHKEKKIFNILVNISEIKTKSKPFCKKLRKKFENKKGKKKNILFEIKNAKKNLENIETEPLNEIKFDINKKTEKDVNIKGKNAEKIYNENKIVLKPKFSGENSYITNLNINMGDQKLIFDDGLGYYLGNDAFFKDNNISLRIKDYHYYLNFESPSISNKYFFC